VLFPRLLAALVLVGFVIPGAPAQCTIAARHPVKDIFFLGQSQGWIIYSEGTTQYIARTHDGGKSWSSALSGAPLTKIYFLTPRLGWGAGVKSLGSGKALSYTLPLFVTSDGGEHWSRVRAKGFPGKKPMMLNGILFVDRQHGWLVGSKEYGFSFVYETFDGGQTFHYVSALSD
jgi:photosystem II stability/assembly factor-like uncharacterized protein